MSQTRPAFLKLSVSTEWDSYDVQMSPGDAFTIGRSPDCKIPVPRSSVSQEHVRISWSGWELTIEDLKSANGTVRLPQESPFVSATFAQKQDSLELRLSKSPVSLRWTVVSDLSVNETLIQGTATEVAPKESLPNDSELKLKPHTKILSPSELAQTLEQIDVENADKKHAKRATIKPADELRDKTQTYVTQGSSPLASTEKNKTAPDSKLQKNRNLSDEQKKDSVAEPSAASDKLAERPVSEKSLEAASWCFAMIPATLALALSFFVGRNLLGGIAKAPGFQLLLGGVHDAVLILLALYRHFGFELCLVPLLTVVFSLLAQRMLFKKQPHWILPVARVFERDKFWGTRKYKAWIASNAFLTVTWPLFWAMHFGFSPSKIARYNEFLNVTRVADQNSPAQNILELKKFTEVFSGSSLLYKHLLFNQRARILGECAGIGEKASWQSKKNCLILLEAAATETYQDVRPALLNDVAQRVAILLSLDGIVRTLTVEGRRSESLKFFLSSLDEIGLAAEKSDIQKIIEGAEFDDERAISLLRDLRRRIELRLDLRQLELGFPNALYIRVPGPLESGI